MATKTKAEPGKVERKRLAKSELWLNFAMSAQRWADTIKGAIATEAKIAAGGDQGGKDTPPMSKWGKDDPINVLMALYDLTPKDMARLCEQIAQEVENRALRAGYEDRWDGE